MILPLKDTPHNTNVWYDFYNKDGNQGPYRFRFISLIKLDLNDFKSGHISIGKDNMSFWLVKLEIIPLFSNCFYTASAISDDFFISDSNGNTYNAVNMKPSYDEPGICEELSLHKYDYSIKVPNCRYNASLLFNLPDSADMNLYINFNDTPKPWYTNRKDEHSNEILLDDVIGSGSWYRLKFKDSSDLDIRISVNGFKSLPLSQSFAATKDNVFYQGYYNLEDSEFKVLDLKVINNSKRENSEVGNYLLGRLILLDGAGFYYAAQGSAKDFTVDFTSSILNNDVLQQILTPKITYDTSIAFLVKKNISVSSLGLRYGILEII